MIQQFYQKYFCCSKCKKKNIWKQKSILNYFCVDTILRFSRKISHKNWRSLSDLMWYSRRLCAAVATVANPASMAEVGIA
jgi:hypothetical protein